MADRDALPVLWHLELSHYNEKVRWALDYKRIHHRRRPLAPGAHVLVARRLTGGACLTTPVLTLDGHSIGDSTRIIAELERYRPHPALYPAEPGECERALALARFCDVEVGEHVRRLAYERLLARPASLGPVFQHDQPAAVRAVQRLGFPLLRFGISRRFEVTADAAAASRERLLAAFDSLERALIDGGGDYLVGGRFSVADITAAALLSPVVRPASFPYPLPANLGAETTAELDALAARPLGRWAARMYERHRLAAGVRRSWVPVRARG